MIFTDHMRPLVIAVLAATLTVSGFCQQPSANPPAAGTDHKMASRLPADMLAPLSDSLQQLASKVSPAVVQIEVSGFGPAEDSSIKDTALIVRQHATG
ncbi:MAG: hypothetical protein JO249_25470, partial [Acidobacteria bacterium]|nr:hypothetical protein [Acidobacteriota bacterium]